MPYWPVSEMLGKKAARAASTLASADGELRFGGADVGPLEQQLRRQARRHARDAEPVEAAAAHLEIGGRAADQHGERGDVLAQRLVERRDRGALGRDQAFLLGDFERRGGAGVEAAA